jgi:vancomycin permeability regulator SanA
MFRVVKKLISILFLFAIIGILTLMSINIYVTYSTNPYILSTDDIGTIGGADAILVLGCRVNGDSPSDMLRDRLTRGVELYELDASQKLLMSGDHGQEDYDEVGVMKQFAIDHDVPSEDIFMDHAGFSTYESMYRARDIFGVKKVVIVTQEYHLSRSVYIARALGIDAYGVASDLNTYSGQGNRQLLGN